MLDDQHTTCENVTGTDEDRCGQNPRNRDGRDAPQGCGEDFRTADGLRALLDRLHRAGAGAWEQDPVAAELMRFAAQKYSLLARKYGLDPWEAASAAFDVMCTKAARTAVDPWGVVTHAVRITCVFEERAQGLLCSVHQARRPHISKFHDPERFGDRLNPLTDYDRAFQITDSTNVIDHDDQAALSQMPTSAEKVVEGAISLLVSAEWPAPTARAGVEYVCAELSKAGGRHTAYERLRRDKHARALLDLTRDAWKALVRALLGNPHPAYAATAAGRGVLLRLSIGEDPRALARDGELMLCLALAAPARRTRGGSR